MSTSERIGILLTPHGRLMLSVDEEAPELGLDLTMRLSTAFAKGSGHGLLQLAAAEADTVLPAVFCYWREFASGFISSLCTHTDFESRKFAVPLPSELDRLLLSAPPMRGAEYLTADLLAALWTQLENAFAIELKESGLGIQEFLKQRNPAWNLVGRVHFNLAENRKDADSPFAFLATYTTRMSAQGKAQHLPLGQALREYVGAANTERLLSLLQPVQRAAETCPWLKTMVAESEIFHPLRWTPAEAMNLLRDVPKLESAGVVVRMPATWRLNHPPRPKVTAMIGAAAPSNLGFDALLDFQMQLTLDGDQLTQQEIRELLAGSDGLAMVRGRWVEVDQERLRRTIEQFEEVERRAAENGIGFREAMRMLAGADIGEDAETASEPDWAQAVAGPWLAETLKGLRSPEGLAHIEPGGALNATLRPYQQVGVRWLYLLAKLGLGACLADDMGLGKTIQVLSLLTVLKTQSRGEAKPSLLVAPASLLANWESELQRFTPGLKAMIAHPSAMAATDLKADAPKALSNTDLVITSYGAMIRVPWLQETSWRLAVLDEAQAIKNPGAKQTTAVKKLKADARLALTGTPVENRLGDLWSIFDFINPGLLGSAKEFQVFLKNAAGKQSSPFAPLRELVRPYILRRMKTDKSVISDLPDKTEIKAYCQLSRKQAALYEDSVKSLTQQLESATGIQRRGLVLSFLMRFKQICNHPSQWLGDAAWEEEESGKWARLRDIVETIAARQEKVLVFTQFREVTTPLAGFLSTVFGRPGLILHGETPVKKRKELVQQFQEEDGAGFFVLSLKAGGAGLNLTAASHVVHFDRWWNPAVENQATDRAFRIGQKKNVMVHKFICRGTVEEKIDELIESKRKLSTDVLEGGADLLLTEMKDDELLKLVALDLNKAIREN